MPNPLFGTLLERTTPFMDGNLVCIVMLLLEMPMLHYTIRQVENDVFVKKAHKYLLLIHVVFYNIFQNQLIFSVSRRFKQNPS